MCGIAGIFDLTGRRPIDGRALKRMTDAVAHRGPDGEGYFEAPGIGLGHRRLAIIDIEGGAQPFRSADRAGAISFNGEIYNFRDLRRGLVDAGVEFRTNSDTEALLEGLQREGPDFVSKLRGMFAFAWWNDNTETLTLARDRFGEKPLYYAVSADGLLVFGSEIGAIRATGLVSLTHSTEALHDYFLYGYVPDPKSIYDGVLKAPPGSVITCRRGAAPEIVRYWRPSFTIDRSISFGAATEQLVGLLDDAVTSQTIGDAPLGAFLSGGVDSSSIVASLAQGGRRTTTCTIGFDEASFDERAAARETARRCQTDHHEEVVRLDEGGLIDRIAAVYGEPFADPSALPSYEVSRAARRRVKVALSGDGADEIFGGYRRYPFFAAEERLRRAAPLALRRATFGAAGALYPKLDWAPRSLRLKTTLQSLGEDSLTAYARAVSTSLPDRLARVLSPDFLAAARTYDPLQPLLASVSSARLPPLSLAQEIDLATWLPGRMLTKIDRASMANGLEVRAPFLDHRLAEWALALPPEFRAAGGVGKRILRASQKARVDSRILAGAKRGFSPPVAMWLRREGGPADRLRQSSVWKSVGYFSTEGVMRMIADHQRGAADHAQELWMLIMFDAFLTHERA